jgi:tetratricopeptide (TPR) repeat protein
VLDPASEQWKEGLAIAFFLQGKNADLVSYVESLLKSQPDSKRLLDLQAKGFIRLEQPLRAAQNYELLEMMGQADFEVLASLGDIYVNEQLFEMATSAYSRALAFEAQAEASRPLEAAKVMVANSAFESAMVLTDAVELTFRGRMSETVTQDIWKLRALTASLTDQVGEQIAALKQLIAVDPLNGQALLKLGRLHLQEEQPIESMIYFERAEAMDKFAASAKLGHAQALVAQDKFNEAVPLLRASLALEDREPVRQYLRQIESLATGR